MGTGPAQPAGLPAGLGFSPSLGISDILSCLGEAGSQRGPTEMGPSCVRPGSRDGPLSPAHRELRRSAPSL